MDIPDFINACFQMAAGILIWLNVARIYRDKQLKGVRILPTLLFVAWGFWNLFYYSHLNQMFSLIFGLSATTANVAWTILAIHYFIKGRRNEKSSI